MAFSAPRICRSAGVHTSCAPVTLPAFARTTRQIGVSARLGSAAPTVRQHKPVSVPIKVARRRPDCRAAATPIMAAANMSSHQSKASSLKVAVYILLWYAFNIIFNLLNKSTLNAFPCPWFISSFQLASSALCMVFLWATGLQPRPRVTAPFLKALSIVALFHTIGHVSACLSFSQMAVSFAHVVKAAEPVLSVALSQVILGEVYPYYVWLSLVPIILGCSLAAMKEVSFAWNGFNNAMVSNVGMVLRNIYSKKFLTDYQDIDGVNLFGVISIFSLLYCVPLALLLEGSQWRAAWQAGILASGSPAAFYKILAAGGLFYHLYNQASYMVLDQGISPVTFSVGNTMKRVSVVVSSILFFRNPVSLLNWVGSLMAMGGTFLYSLAKQRASSEANLTSTKVA